MKFFASGLSFKETLGVLRNDFKQLHKFPSFFRVFTTASIIYVTGSLFSQLRFIVGEYSPETEAEAKERRAHERIMRIRNSLTDGERDLLVWQEKNKERVERLVEDLK